MALFSPTMAAKRARRSCSMAGGDFESMACIPDMILNRAGTGGTLQPRATRQQQRHREWCTVLEPPPPSRFELRDLLGAFRSVYVVNAVVAFLFAITAPV